jgi:hypothetical protein
MKGLRVMLKALGIEVSDEHIQAVQELIPQLPAKLNQAANAINSAMQNFDGRLQALEKSNQEILALLREQNAGRRTDPADRIGD